MLRTFLNLSIACALVTGSALAGPRASSIDRLAHQVMTPATRALGTLMPVHRSVALAIRFQLQDTPGRANALEPLLTRIVMGHLTAIPNSRIEIIPSLPTSPAANLSEAAEAGGHDYLLLLDFTTHGDYAHLMGTIWRVRSNFWAKVREPVGGVQQHFFGRVRIGAALRRLLSLAQKPLSPKLTEIALAPPNALSVTSGDLDGDGYDEVAWLMPDSVRIERWRKNLGHVIVQAELGNPPPQTVRLRYESGTIASLDIDGDAIHELAIWTSRYSRGRMYSLHSSAGLKPLRGGPTNTACGGMPLSDRYQFCGPVLSVRRSQTFQEGDMLLVGETEQLTGRRLPRAWGLQEDGGLVDVPLRGAVVGVSTGTFPTEALGEAIDITGTVNRAGYLRLVVGETHVSVRKAGAQLVLSDLNDDGTVELIRTRDSRVGQQDKVIVHELLGDTVPVVFQSEVPTVVALSAGDSDNDGKSDVIILSRGGRVHRLVSEADNEI